ncbi:hypothetical protein NW754_003339 [Fusarium falciforme]|nr:hypothetical protein NW754_003339 [Fusarium falciforme]KAJ4200173.1 hypothetical protein NW767_007694 [Fusarium falciforme]KAJ4248253.1 hypothetical protein NW757_008411 [Fusarium falciforme]
MATAAIDASAFDVIARCLTVALDVYRVVRDIHHGGQASIAVADFAGLSDALSKSVQHIKGVVQETGRYGHGQPLFLIRFACVKISEDLVVHIDRVLKSPVVKDELIDSADFCDLWSLDDLHALGLRLDQVVHRFKEMREDSGLDDAEGALQHPSLGDLAASDIDPDETDSLAQQLMSAPASPTSAPRLAPAGIINDFILESLAYSSMRDREDEVTEAHSRTLEWIFDDSPLTQPLRNAFRDSFTTWLKTNELGPIYWITGKPGSGKSTLMRFLSQDRTAMEYLRLWAADKPINTAGFFFWTSGSRQQRSQTGLLRSLLHQLLSSSPELIAKTFPDLWTRVRQMTTKERISLELEWTIADLRAALDTFLNTALKDANICLFIDGLDEFDGDHHEIIDFFKSLTTRDHGNSLKMCLSSRPWAVFDEAFGNSVPNTKLQDLSYEDMCRYVKDAFRSSTPLRRLMRMNETSGQLILATVERADGVFLWVRLAVERMLSAFARREELETLQKTLQSLPSDLDALFEKLLFQDQSGSEVLDTAALFQLIHAREVVADFIKDESSTSLTIWELAFALHKEDDAAALEREVCEATDEELQTRCATTARHIKNRFSGLLNIHQRRIGNQRVHRADVAKLVTSCRVIYIHRTVRDWLMEANGAGERLKARQSQDFDAHLRLLRSYVLRLKFSLDEIEHHRRLDEWYPDIALAMSHARYITNDPDNLQRPLLNEMNKTLSWLWLDKPSDPYDHWAKSTFGAYEIRMKAPPIRRPFLCLATKFGLTEYVSQEVQHAQTSNGEDEEHEDDSTPLLSYATEFLCSRNKTIFPLSSPKLVRFLITHQSTINPGPDHKYKHFVTGQSTTPWLAVLRHLRDAKRRNWIEHYDIDPEGTQRWAEIVTMFIEHADAKAVVKRDAWDPEITALGVMKLLEDTYGAADMQRLRVLMESRIEQMQ